MEAARDEPGGVALTDHLRLIAGLGQGISAFIVGYVAVTALWFAEAAVAGTYTGFGGLVYGGLERLLATHVGAVGGPALLPDAGSAAAFAAAYRLVPVVVLAFYGRAIAVRYPTPSAPAAAVAGASTAVGYAIAVLGSAAALTLLVDALLSALGVEVVTAGLAAGGSSLRVLLVAGLLYPVVFGGLGGYAAYRWRQRNG